MKHSGYERNKNDWYIEPDWAVDVLLADESSKGFGNLKLMDPCCGSGNIPTSLKKAGFKNVVGSDIVDRANGEYEVGHYEDMLHTHRPDVVISNPPYNEVKEFVDEALKHSSKVCVLLRLAFLEGQARRDWFKNGCLSRVIVSSRRMSMPPGGTDIKAKGGTIAYAWFIFDRDHEGPPTLAWG